MMMMMTMMICRGQNLTTERKERKSDREVTGSSGHESITSGPLSNGRRRPGTTIASANTFKRGVFIRYELVPKPSVPHASRVSL